MCGDFYFILQGDGFGGNGERMPYQSGKGEDHIGDILVTVLQGKHSYVFQSTINKMRMYLGLQSLIPGVLAQKLHFSYLGHESGVFFNQVVIGVYQMVQFFVLLLIFFVGFRVQSEIIRIGFPNIRGEIQYLSG